MVQAELARATLGREVLGTATVLRTLNVPKLVRIGSLRHAVLVIPRAVLLVLVVVAFALTAGLRWADMESTWKLNLGSLALAHGLYARTTDARVEYLREAENDFGALVEGNPRSPLPLFLLGMTQEASGRTDRAVDVFTSVVNMDPNNDSAREALFRLGRLYYELGQTDKTIELWKRANNTRSPIEYAKAIFKDGDKDAAGRITELVIGIEPSYEAYYLLGEIRSDQGRSQEAIAAYREALQQPTKGKPYIAQARLYELTGDWPAAAVALEKAIEVSPVAGAYYYDLARIAYYNLGDPVRAMGALRKGVKAVPSYSWSLLFLASIEAQQGQCDEASAQLDEASRVGRPPGVREWASLANCYAARGQLTRAVQLMRSAVQANPTDPSYPRTLGDLYREMGEPALASQEYWRALDLAPGDQASRDGLAALGQQP